MTTGWEIVAAGTVHILDSLFGLVSGDFLVASFFAAFVSMISTFS